MAASAHAQFPWVSGISLPVKLGLLAAYTSLAVVIVFATIQRCLIRLLLRYKGFLYNARKPTVVMRVWFLVMKLLVGNRKHRLYSFQGVLPSLPVPPLQDTVRRYLDSVEPFQEPEKFARTKVQSRTMDCAPRVLPR